MSLRLPSPSSPSELVLCTPRVPTLLLLPLIFFCCCSCCSYSPTTLFYLSLFAFGLTVCSGCWWWWCRRRQLPLTSPLSACCLLAGWLQKLQRQNSSPTPSVGSCRVPVSASFSLRLRISRVSRRLVPSLSDFQSRG